MGRGVLRYIRRIMFRALTPPAPPRRPPRWRALLRPLLAALMLLAVLAPSTASAQDGGDLIRDARDAYVHKDKAKLAALRIAAVDAKLPLAYWVDYWDLSSRITEARAAEVDAFFARWPGTYVEDRLRNDWLLELGKRRDWATFARQMPRFKMNDDHEVSCYDLVARFQTGEAVAEAARHAWMAERDIGDGCQLLAQTMYDARQFNSEDIWRKIRVAVEHNHLGVARQVSAILGGGVPKALNEALDKPAHYLALRASALGQNRAELSSVALARMAASDPDAAARMLKDRWGAILVGPHGGWAWAMVARQAALGLRPEALEWSRNAWSELKKRDAGHPDWSNDTLGWLARASLRLAPAPERWTLVLRSIDAMSDDARAQPTWQYWQARALQGLAAPGAAGARQRDQARQMLSALSTQFNFYGQLAAEDLGAPQALPGPAAPPTDAEREAALKQPGLQRALLALDQGLRSEGVREWNFSLIGMDDRALLAAAQLACDHAVWDRCINTSERTRGEVDFAQRYPMPMKDAMLGAARQARIDPAYVYGLIRQESRFIHESRSGVGAYGLMQVMPATARWTAKKIGLADYRPEQLAEPDTNLRLGTAYLKLVLDSLDGSEALAAAAYNAGPNRPRRWRDGPVLEPAVWIENVPISETRDYIKKVLSNATYYAGLLEGRTASLKARLGASIGPRPSGEAPSGNDLP